MFEGGASLAVVLIEEGKGASIGSSGMGDREKSEKRNVAK